MYLAQPRIPLSNEIWGSGAVASGAGRGNLQADRDSFQRTNSMNYGKYHPGEPQQYLMPVVTRGGAAENKHDVSHQVDQQSGLRTTSTIPIPPPRILLNQCKTRSSSVADLGYLSAQAKRSELAYLIVDLQNPTEQIFTGDLDMSGEEQGKDASFNKRGSLQRLGGGIKEKFKKLPKIGKGGSSKSVSGIVEGSPADRRISFLAKRRTVSCDTARSTQTTPIHTEATPIRTEATPIHSTGVGEYVIMTRGSSICESPPDSSSVTTPAVRGDLSQHSASTTHGNSQVKFDSTVVSKDNEIDDSKVTHVTPLKGKAQPLNSASSSPLSTTMLAKETSVSRDESLQVTEHSTSPNSKSRSKTMCVTSSSSSSSSPSRNSIDSAKALAMLRAKERRKPPTKPLPYSQTRRQEPASSEPTNRTSSGSLDSVKISRRSAPLPPVLLTSPTRHPPSPTPHQADKSSPGTSPVPKPGSAHHTRGGRLSPTPPATPPGHSTSPLPKPHLAKKPAAAAATTTTTTTIGATTAKTTTGATTTTTTGATKTTTGATKTSGATKTTTSGATGAEAFTSSQSSTDTDEETVTFPLPPRRIMRPHPPTRPSPFEKSASGIAKSYSSRSGSDVVSPPIKSPKASRFSSTLSRVSSMREYYRSSKSNTTILHNTSEPILKSASTSSSSSKLHPSEPVYEEIKDWAVGMPREPLSTRGGGRGGDLNSVYGGSRSLTRLSKKTGGRDLFLSVPDSASWSDGSDTGDADDYIDMKSFLKGRGQPSAVSGTGSSSSSNIKREVDDGDPDDTYVDMRRSVVTKTVSSDDGSQNLALEDSFKDEPYVKMNPAVLPHQSSMVAKTQMTGSLLPPPSSPAPIYEPIQQPGVSASVPMPSPPSTSGGSDSLYYASRDMLALNSQSKS